MFPLPSTQTCETRFPIEAEIPGIHDTSVPVISGTGANIVCSYSPQCGPEGPESVSGCGTGAFFYIDRPERSGYGLRPRTGLQDRDYRDPGVC